MNREYSLSEDQMELLEEGESVEITATWREGRVKLHPPCGKYEHDWGSYSLIKRDGDVLTRTCSKCGIREETGFQPEEEFED